MKDEGIKWFLHEVKGFEAAEQERCRIAFSRISTLFSPQFPIAWGNRRRTPKASLFCCLVVLCAS